MSRRATILLQALRARQNAALTTRVAIRPSPSGLALRQLHPCPPNLARPGPSTWSTPDDAAPPANPLKARDGDIPFHTVQLVDPSTNSLGPPTPLAQILGSYDPHTHMLVVVSADPPIVKLLDREAERLKQRAAEARSKLRRKTSVEDKEIQISWGSALGDLKHKANVAKGILEKGDRVELVFASKANAEKVDAERKEEMVAMFEEVLAEVGQRWKNDERNKGVRISYWAPKSEIREAVRDKVMEEEIGKRKDKDEKKVARRRKEEERKQRAATKAS